MPGIDKYSGLQKDLPTPFLLPHSEMMQNLVDDTNARLTSDRGSFHETKKMKGLFPFPSQSHERFYRQKYLPTYILSPRP